MLDNVQQQSGRWTGQGARDCREDGRHPRYEDHGRIAGRWSRIAISVPQSCAWSLCFWAPLSR